MRILIVTESPPTAGARGGDGHALILARILPRLSERAEVHLRYFPAPGVTPELPGVESADVLPLRPRAVRILGPLAVWRLPSTFARDGLRARRIVRAESAAADVALFHGPKVVPLARAALCPTVVQHVDAWSNQLRHRMESTPWMRRAFAVHLGMVRRAERRSGAAMHLTVSEPDAAALSRSLGVPVTPVPNGVVRDETQAPFDQRSGIVFVGSLDYWPNIQAATRLRHEIFPRLRDRRPGLGVRVVGRSPAPQVRSLAAPGFEIVADVPDIQAELRRARLAVFPDEFGSGTRNAVSEAVCAGLPVIATPHAARNQPSGPHLILARSAEEFAARIAELDERHPWERAHQVARQASGRYPTWEEVADRYLELLGTVRGRGSTRLAGT